MALFALLPAVVDAVGTKVPVAGAGSIVDGRGVAAAFALGADAVWCGTRFIATHEAHAVPHYKSSILNAKSDSTAISRSYTGKPCRVIRSDWTREWEAKADKIQPFPMQARTSVMAGVNHIGQGKDTTGVDPSKEFFMCGQGAELIKDIVSAEVQVRRYLEELTKELNRLGHLNKTNVLLSSKL